jgi:hypothetical protein
MTKMEALKMVRSAQQHIFPNVFTVGRHPRLLRKATREAYNCLLNAERGLEFEAMFEQGGEPRRTW